MPSLDPVFSVGRGGAGNMMNANTAQKAENEVVLQEEGIRKGKNKSGSFKADKEGNYTVSAGRGGAGNIYKVKEDPLTTRNREDAQNQDHEMEDLRPVYSVGRGGAGNMVWRNKKGESNNDVMNTTIREDIDHNISPVHSGASGRSYVENLQDNASNNRGHKFLQKIKKVFAFN